MKVAIYPPNSLILTDLIERAGHEAVTIMKELSDRVRDAEMDSPPLNITPEDPSKGLKWASAEAPSGVRGRLAVFAPIYEQVDAIVALKNGPINFGCLACARTNEFLLYLVHSSDKPHIILEYPSTPDEATAVVTKILSFLKEVAEHD